MLIHITSSNSGFRDDFGQYDENLRSEKFHCFWMN